MTGFFGLTYLITGANQSRFGNSPNGSPTVGLYEALDGPFYMACANDRLVRRLMVDVLGRPELVTDPLFATRKARSLNKEKLRSLLNSIFKDDTRDSWMARMKTANVPVGYLRTIEEAYNSPEMRERHRLSQIPHPTAGTVPNVESPLQMGLTSIVDPVAAPLLGQHTNDVLRKTLGYDDSRIAKLAEAGVFGGVLHKG
jgi:crotonobetainyl-CoA:carnitine CoA-transferase CaiB-like acyl-CoA transferase